MKVKSQYKRSGKKIWFKRLEASLSSIQWMPPSNLAEMSVVIKFSERDNHYLVPVFNDEWRSSLNNGGNRWFERSRFAAKLRQRCECFNGNEELSCKFESATICYWQIVKSIRNISLISKFFSSSHDSHYCNNHGKKVNLKLRLLYT